MLIIEISGAKHRDYFMESVHCMDFIHNRCAVSQNKQVRLCEPVKFIIRTVFSKRF